MEVLQLEVSGPNHKAALLRGFGDNLSTSVFCLVQYCHWDLVWIEITIHINIYNLRALNSGTYMWVVMSCKDMYISLSSAASGFGPIDSNNLILA